MKFKEYLSEVEEFGKPDGTKTYKEQHGIGKAKYTVSFHDGKKTHKDGSKFYDIKILKNKKDLDAFIQQLRKDGYKPV